MEKVKRLRDIKSLIGSMIFLSIAIGLINDSLNSISHGVINLVIAISLGILSIIEFKMLNKIKDIQKKEKVWVVSLGTIFFIIAAFYILTLRNLIL